jgi:hypothetical protein
MIIFEDKNQFLLTKSTMRLEMTWLNKSKQASDNEMISQMVMQSVFA